MKNASRIELWIKFFVKHVEIVSKYISIYQYVPICISTLLPSCISWLAKQWIIKLLINMNITKNWVCKKWLFFYILCFEICIWDTNLRVRHLHPYKLSSLWYYVHILEATIISNNINYIWKKQKIKNKKIANSCKEFQ